MVVELGRGAQALGADDGQELLGGAIEVAVDHEVVELRRVLDLAARTSQPAQDGFLRILPRPRRRRSSSSREGGRMKIVTQSGTFSRTCRAPCQSISSSTSRPAARCGSTDWRAVPL